MPWKNVRFIHKVVQFLSSKSDNITTHMAYVDVSFLVCKQSTFPPIFLQHVRSSILSLFPYLKWMKLTWNFPTKRSSPWGIRTMLMSLTPYFSCWRDFPMIQNPPSFKSTSCLCHPLAVRPQWIQMNSCNDPTVCFTYFHFHSLILTSLLSLDLDIGTWDIPHAWVPKSSKNASEMKTYANHPWFNIICCMTMEGRMDC